MTIPLQSSNVAGKLLNLGREVVNHIHFHALPDIVTSGQIGPRMAILKCATLRLLAVLFYLATTALSFIGNLAKKT